MTYANPLLHKPSRAMPKRVVVVGAGTIGPDIGYYLKSAIPELTLHLVDVAQAPLDRAVERFKSYARKGAERGKMSKARAQQVTENLHTSLEYAVAREADWVLEAATEDLALKRKIFAQIEELVRPDTIITSNTSSLPAERIFAELRHKERGDGDPLLRPGLAQPDRRSDPLGGRRSTPRQRPQLDFLHDRQGAVGHRRRRLLHARPRVRQLVQRRGVALERGKRRRDRHDHARVRACRPVLRAQSRQRQPDHR